MTRVCGEKMITMRSNIASVLLTIDKPEEKIAKITTILLKRRVQWDIESADTPFDDLLDGIPLAELAQKQDVQSKVLKNYNDTLDEIAKIIKTEGTDEEKVKRIVAFII